MLFPDITCVVSDSLKKNVEYGIYELLKADLAVVVTIRRSTKKVIINGTVGNHEVDETVAYQFLEEYKDQFLNGVSISNLQYHDYYFHMYSRKEAKSFLAFTIICKKGKPFNNKDLKWLSIYSDLNYKRVLLANEAEQNKNYYENVFESSSAAIVGLNLSCKVITANSAAKNMMSFDKDGGIVFLDSAQREKLFDAIHSVIQSKQKYYFNKFVYSKEDHDLVLSAVISPLRDSKDKVAGVGLVATDITDSDLLSLEVEQLKQYGLLGEISAGLAHDIKNPLMSIRGSAKLLSKNDCDPAMQASLINIIIHETDRIDEVINQMMIYGDISKNKKESLLNLNTILQDCSQIIGRQKFTKKIDFRFSLDEKLPLVWAKDIHMKQVFSNLLLNALQAIEQEGIILISSVYSPDEKQIWITIEDNGKGFSPEVGNKIFNPYFTTKENGTGMGLFIVKRTLSKYNAVIKIDSVKGKGTCCRVGFSI